MWLNSFGVYFGILCGGIFGLFALCRGGGAVGSVWFFVRLFVCSGSFCAVVFLCTFNVGKILKGPYHQKFIENKLLIQEHSEAFSPAVLTLFSSHRIRCWGLVSCCRIWKNTGTISAPTMRIQSLVCRNELWWQSSACRTRWWRRNSFLSEQLNHWEAFSNFFLF